MLNRRAPAGDTALHTAMAVGHIAGIDTLLRAGAKPNVFAGPEQL
jgi:ankyrin repeat protein